MKPKISSSHPFNGYLPTLDGWRAVAIIIVLAAHGIDSAIVQVGSALQWLRPIYYYGGFGVNIFFALSGLLITSRLLQEAEQNGRISLSAFYIRRSFRILPAFVTMLAVTALLTAFDILSVSWKDLVRALFFLTNYSTDPSWYVAHTWSLSLEEHFYLIWPLTLSLLGFKKAAWIGALACLLISFWRVAIIHFQIGAAVGWRTDAQLDAILWGAVAACLVRNRSNFFRQPNRAWLVYALLLIIVGSMIALSFQPRLAHLVRFSQPILLSVLLIATVSCPATSLGKVLELPAVRWVGRLSFSLYLWNQLFLAPASATATTMQWLQIFPLNILAVLACAVVSYYLIERPFITLGRRVVKSAIEGRC
jgi:peptidoglycan/LPS O-acetylase OafA/YrhL